MDFIDLFAGLGGFHLALKHLGHKCVFASELNEDLRALYKANHGIDCNGDITKVDIESIPPHNIICAGFPCQPFSKAGKQAGLKDSVNGNFFDLIMKIADLYVPEYIFLENVPNLKSHDGGKTWEYIRKRLSQMYEVKEDILSPHKFGVPQHRSRIYIVCRLKSKGGLSGFEFPKGEVDEKLSIKSIIENKPKEYTSIRKDSKKQLRAWQAFLKHLKPDEVPGFPIWAMEFGATYPYEDEAPSSLSIEELKRYRGVLGEKIEGHSMDEILNCLPRYAQGLEKEFPDWKKIFIRNNREFYSKHKKWIDKWRHRIKGFDASHQKFEWNCGTDGPLRIKDKIVQFRPSGIRVKKPNFSPALVLNATQIPVFPWLGRYMTPREAARLQCMSDLKEVPKISVKAFRAFGNAVNVCVVKKIAENLLKTEASSKT